MQTCEKEQVLFHVFIFTRPKERPSPLQCSGADVLHDGHHSYITHTFVSACEKNHTLLTLFILPKKIAKNDSTLLNLHSFYLAFVIYFHAKRPSWLIWYQRLLIWEQHLKLLFSRALLKRVYRPFRDTFHSFLNIWKFSLKNLVSCYLLSFSLFAVTLGPILRWNHFWDSQCRDSQSHNVHSEREVDLTRNYGYFESSRLGGEVERLLWWLRAGVGTKQMTFQWQFSNSGIHLFQVMTSGKYKNTKT